MNKKGVFGLEEIFGLYIIVFLVLLFFLLIVFTGLKNTLFGGPPEEVIKALELQENKDYILALLQTPVEDVSEEIKNSTLSDLIIYSVSNKDYTLLDASIKKTFEIFEGKDYFWSFSLTDYDNPEVVYYTLTREGYYIKNFQEPIQEAIIPQYKTEGKIVVKIRITEGMPVSEGVYI